ncbi:MAG: hypothetical protein QOI69_2248 [Pseudonocardiales bacterium]|jgi:hypothetical protein|nr:hypothetical protein [Pseudonocardiales bacterium]
MVVTWVGHVAHAALVKAGGPPSGAMPTPGPVMTGGGGGGFTLPIAPSLDPNMVRGAELTGLVGVVILLGLVFAT